MNVIFNSKISQTIQSIRKIPIHFGKKKIKQDSFFKIWDWEFMTPYGDF